MPTHDKAAPNNERERFEKDLAALLVVPKSEVSALEARRPKKSRKPPKS
jgi:hypothetical protein